jgi:hypothetical protein
MTIDYLSPDEQSFVAWMKRPSVMNKRKAIELITICEEEIERLKVKVKNATSHLEKNRLYHSIENRQAQIKWADGWLT